MSKEHVFDEKELLASRSESLEHPRGKRTLKTTKWAKPVAPMSPERIAPISRKMKASTPLFASYLNVTSDTVRGWERARRRHFGSALKLLEIADKSPRALVD